MQLSGMFAWHAQALGLNPTTLQRGTVAQAYNLSTWEVEAKMFRISLSDTVSLS